jgi:dUTP pyrophosphatase
MKIRITNKSANNLPAYSIIASAGMDIRDNLEEDIILKPMERALVKTGLYPEIPEGYEAQIPPGYGLAINIGVTILNLPGTIDADYRGEICIILINLSTESFS